MNDRRRIVPAKIRWGQSA